MNSAATAQASATSFCGVSDSPRIQALAKTPITGFTNVMSDATTADR